MHQPRRRRRRRSSFNNSHYALSPSRVAYKRLAQKKPPLIYDSQFDVSLVRL